MFGIERCDNIRDALSKIYVDDVTIPLMRTSQPYHKTTKILYAKISIWYEAQFVCNGAVSEYLPTLYKKQIFLTG